MPYKIKKNKDGSYSVEGPSGKHAKSTTKSKAEAQTRLLRAIEHNPDFVPRKKKKTKRAKGSKASY